MQSLLKPRRTPTARSSDHDWQFVVTEASIADLACCMEGRPDHDMVIFNYRLMLVTIEACLAGSYHLFDAHTATNCCHGVALLAADLLKIATRCELEPLKRTGEGAMESVLAGIDFEWKVPGIFLTLAKLYALQLASEEGANGIRYGAPQKLLSLAEISKKGCRRLVKKWQAEIANEVASRYGMLATTLPLGVRTNNVPAWLWGKYVKGNYLKQDSSGRRYASCLFSMQVALGSLSSSKSRIVWLNDVKSDGQFVRLMKVLEGDGKGRFRPVPQDELLAAPIDSHESCVVFQGVSYPSCQEPTAIEMAMDSWATQFDALVLACDLKYPQFPKVAGDEAFDGEPISPSEWTLQRLLGQYSMIKGVSADDPSLFCMTHVFPASMNQVMQLMSGKRSGLFPVCDLHADLLSS
ncbi:MAG: hypothetical protein AB7M93_29990 [Candidatus Obscuribacterales bacterium]